MKILFFGTPEFAAKTLELLLQSLKETSTSIVAVVTRPDKAKGRSSAKVPTPVKEISLKQHLPCYQPPKASDPEFIEELKKYEADLFVVVAYGEIVKQNLLNIPKLGCINVHASLLPKYRGAAPIERAIMNGEKETGVTIMQMVLKLDAGDIIRSVRVPIGENTTKEELKSALLDAGTKTLLQVIDDFKEMKIVKCPQDESQASYASKIELEDCEIHWEKEGVAIHNLIRAVTPSPGAWSYVMVKDEKKRLKILSSRYEGNLKGAPGTVLVFGKESIVVACGEGAIQILELQLEGKRPMSAKEFTSGHTSPTFVV